MDEILTTNWLVTVDEFSVKIELAQILRSWDWSCEIEGDLHCYRVTSGVYNMPKNGQDRAQVEIMYHARNIAGDAPIAWKLRGKKPVAVSKKKQEILSKMKPMF